MKRRAFLRLVTSAMALPVAGGPHWSQAYPQAIRAGRYLGLGGAKVIYRPLLILAMFALGLCLLPAQAEDQLTAFKGKNFNLPTPAGFCVPDLANRLAQLYSAVLKKGGSTVVKYAADCRQLEAGGDISDYLGYYYLTNSEEEVLDGDVAARRKAVCDDLRSHGPTFNGIQAAVSKIARELNQNLGSINPIALGVLAEDVHGCYAGLLSPFELGSIRYIKYGDLLGTVIHARRFYAGLYSKYEDDAGAKKSLARLQALAAQLDAKNPE
jgi:hypothetical protein